jgi:hypothetical protein
VRCRFYLVSMFLGVDVKNVRGQMLLLFEIFGFLFCVDCFG